MMMNGMNLKPMTQLMIFNQFQLIFVVQQPEFLTAVAKWLELWSSSPYFTLSKQTSKAIIASLKAQSMLIQDLLSEGYQYVLQKYYRKKH